MRIAGTFAVLATILTGLALAAWVTLAAIMTASGYEVLANMSAGEGRGQGRGGPSGDPVAGRDSTEAGEPVGDGDSDLDDGAASGDTLADDERHRDDDADADEASADDAEADVADADEANADGADADEANADGADADEANADGADEGQSSDVGGSAGAGEGAGEGDSDGEGDAVAAAGGPPDDIVPAVDWPELPELEGRAPLTTTERFRLYADPVDDPLLTATALEWAPDVDGLLGEVSGRMGLDLSADAASIVFKRAYEARCPARGLAAPGDEPLVLVFVAQTTPDVQIRAVLAHEMAHLLTFGGDFVGDGVLTEGIANWAAGEHALAWQDVPDWETAARRSIREGTYTSVADDFGLNPRPGENCIARRDRVYNARTAFVAWLIDEIGLETVLAMPVREEVRRRADSGEDEVLRLPDYSAAAGASLTQLERRWLAELLADGADIDRPSSGRPDSGGHDSGAETDSPDSGSPDPGAETDSQDSGSDGGAGSGAADGP